MTLPTDYKARKALPLWDFMFGYFTDAWLAVVDVAVAGNKQHNPGEPLHWSRDKSNDHLNTAFRHQFDYGQGSKKDTDGCWHLAKAIWRLSAQLQLDIEAERSEPKVGTGKPIPGITEPSLQGASCKPNDNCQCDTCRMWNQCDTCRVWRGPHKALVPWCENPGCGLNRGHLGRCDG